MPTSPDEARAHIAQIFEMVDQGERFPLMMMVIEDQANDNYLLPHVYLNMLQGQVEALQEKADMERKRGADG